MTRASVQALAFKLGGADGTRTRFPALKAQDPNP